MADEVVVANVFKSDAIPEAERLDLGSLAAQIQGHGRRARIVPEVDGIVQLIAPEMRRGDVVAILSNGGFGGSMRSCRNVCERSPDLQPIRPEPEPKPNRTNVPFLQH